MARTGIRLEAIKPKLIDPAEYERAFMQALESTANDIRRDFEATTATWEHKVRFYVAVTSRKGVLGITASTSDEIYFYVNYGTGLYGPKRQPYTIRAKDGGVLAFKSSYTAKTRKGFIGSGAGGASGESVFAKEVTHPGIEGRRFDQAIAARRQATLEQRINQALAKIARKKGT